MALKSKNEYMFKEWRNWFENKGKTFFHKKEGSQAKLLDKTEFEYPSITYNLESNFARNRKLGNYKVFQKMNWFWKQMYLILRDGCYGNT